MPRTAAAAAECPACPPIRAPTFDLQGLVKGSKIRKTSDGEDIISRLPVCLLQNILFCLPVKDEIRTSLLSKWWNTLVMSSLSQRSFHFNHLDLYDGDRAVYAADDNEREQKFIDFVDESFKRLLVERFKIPIVSINVDLRCFESSSFLDRWLQLVANNHVEKLSLNTCIEFSKKLYHFPEIALASATPLRRLKLKRCKLQQNSLCDNDDIGDNTGALALEDLSFSHVTVDNHDGSFQNFISRCHSLMHLKFFLCYGVKKLQLSNNPKLRTLNISVPFDGDERLEKIEIESLDLHTMRCTAHRNKLFIVEATRCRNLVKLNMTGVEMEYHVIENLATYFPLLKKLRLYECTGFTSLSVLRHPCLETLALSFNNLFELQVVDTPKLIQFTYMVDTIPAMLFISNASSNLSLLKNFRFHFHGPNPVDTLWFLLLKTYLGQFKKMHNLHMTISPRSPTYEFDVDEVSEMATLHDLSFVESTFVESIYLYFTEDYFEDHGRSFEGLFFDGLFWTCHPKSISVTTCLSFTIDYLEGMCEFLVSAKEKNLSCCNGCPVKCWRHFLEDVSIYVNEETVSNKIDTSSADSFDMEPLSQLASYEEVILKLSWV